MQTLSLTSFMISTGGVDEQPHLAGTLAQAHLWGAFLEVSITLRRAVEKDR